MKVQHKKKKYKTKVKHFEENTTQKIDK